MENAVAATTWAPRFSACIFCVLFSYEALRGHPFGPGLHRGQPVLGREGGEGFGLSGWLAGSLVWSGPVWAWLVGWSVDWLAGWLAGWLVCWYWRVGGWWVSE